MSVAYKQYSIAMRTLPYWLRTLDQGVHSLDWHVKSGWLVLNTAALRGGNAAGLRAPYPINPESLLVRIEQYRSLVLDIPRRIGFCDKNLGKGWIRTATQIGEMLAARVWEEGVMQDESCGVSIKEFLIDTRDELSRAFPSIDFSVATPFDALRSAYKGLRQGKFAKSIRTVELYCLAWICIAAHGILKMRHCELCFRWAIPGHKHCYEHSQSKEASGSPQEKSLRYRNAAKISVTYRYPPRPVPRHSKISASRLPQIIARVIWCTPLPDEERTVRSIKEALAKRPAVLAQVGQDALSLTSMALYKQLEERIDPLEINPSAWVWKLKQMDRWERVKTTRCPGHRGKGHLTRWRIVKAISLADMGCSKSMIASILGVCPSTISNWLRRGAFPKLEELLP